jgi:predicted nucleotidyltransferase
MSGRSTGPTLEDIGRALGPLLPPGCQAVLFGSRATGEARPASDWDIGLLGREPLAGAVLERVREALESLPTLHTFEVVDLASVPPAFRETALRGAVRIA